jgi:hypothetical protein
MKICPTLTSSRYFLAAVLVLTGYGHAFAQDSKPMTLTLRPSGQDKVEDSRARQEKLLKRLEQSDYWVRSICVQCGDAWKHQLYAPFNPLEALGRKSGGAEAAAE